LFNYVLFPPSLIGRGFDQDTWSEKDESAICSYNTRSKGGPTKDSCWDMNHPNVSNPRASAGAILLGNITYSQLKGLYSIDTYTKSGRILPTGDIPKL